MASKNFGDDFRGTGALTGAPSLASGIAGASWGTFSTSSGWMGSTFQRSAGGLQLDPPVEGEDRIARMSFTAFALGTASGVAVFEWRVRADVLGAVVVGLGTTRYAQLILNAGSGTASVLNSSSSSAGVSGMPTSGYMVVRIELSTTDTKFYCNGALLTTIAIGWSDSTTISQADYLVYSFAPLVEGVTDTVADYFNAKTETTSGALGAPSIPTGDTTPPTMTGVIAASSIGTTSYVLSWPAATDDVAVTGYEYSMNGGVSWADLGLSRSLTVTGSAPGSTDAVRVRAYDAAGNRSAPLLKEVTLLTSEVPPAPAARPLMPGMTVLADNFVGDSLLTGTKVKQCFMDATWLVGELGEVVSQRAERSAGGLILPASTTPYVVGAYTLDVNTGTATRRQILADSRIVFEARVAKQIWCEFPLYVRVTDSGIECAYLAGGDSTVHAYPRTTNAETTVRVEESLTSVALYADNELVTTFTQTRNLDLPYSPLNAGFSATPGLTAGVVRVRYVNAKLVAVATPPAPLGEAFDPDVTVPGPGNEPDPNQPPFSDFWTRFNNTYEVP